MARIRNQFCIMLKIAVFGITVIESLLSSVQNVEIMQDRVSSSITLSN